MLPRATNSTALLTRRSHRLSSTHPDDRGRRLLGEPHLGLLLELGSEGNLGRDYLVGVCRIPAYADHPGMARTARRLLRDSRLRGSDVYLLRGNLSAARNACLCLASSCRSSRSVDADVRFSTATGFWKKRELCTAGFTAERVHAERGFPLELGSRQLAAESNPAGVFVLLAGLALHPWRQFRCAIPSATQS